MFEKVDVLYGFGWWSGVITKQLAGNRYTVFFKKKNKDLELGESKLRPHMEWRDGKWFSASQRVRGKHQLENLMVDSMDKKGELKDAEKNAKALAQGRMDNSEEESVEDDFVDKECVTKEASTPVVIALECNRRKHSQTKEVDILEVNKENNEKRKRVSETASITATDGETLNEKELQQSPQEQDGMFDSKTNSPLTEKCLVQTETGGGASVVKTKQRLPVKRKRERPSTKGLDQVSVTQDIDEGFKNDRSSVRAEMVSDTSPAASNYDQPLALWLRGNHSRTSSDWLGTSLRRNAEQSLQPRKKLNGKIKQFGQPSKKENEAIPQSSPVIEAKHLDVVPCDSPSLPFTKSSPLWEAIEALEVFRKIPQRPHFHPLGLQKEIEREGLAIARVVNFSTVVEKTSRLQLDDPRSTVEDCLKALVKLEEHGFDVDMVRARLSGLLSIKDRQEELRNESGGLSSSITEHILVKGKIEEKIDRIDKQIRELQEERALVLSMKEEEVALIAALESERQCLNQEAENARLKFSSLATASW